MRGAVVAVCLGWVGFMPAQEVEAVPALKPARPAEICRCIDVRRLDRYDAALDVEPLRRRCAPDRLGEILSRWWRDRGRPASRSRTVEASGWVLHAHGDPEIVQTTQRALAQLFTEDTIVRARVQYSVLTMPRAAAEAEGLKSGAAVSVEVANLTRLVRAAIEQGGTLRNLPEVVATPLRPFAVEVVRAGEAPPLRLRAELVPLGDGEALLGLHVVRGELPANLSNVPDAGENLLASPVLRLTKDAVTLLPLRDGDTATVLVVRAEVGVGQDDPPAAESTRRPQ